MSAVTLNTSGSVSTPVCIVGRDYAWSDLTPFQQGYVEALFSELAHAYAARSATFLRYDRIAPEALALILKDCDAHERDHIVPPSMARFLGETFWQGRQVGGHKAFPTLTVSLGDDGKVHLREAA